jgi:hypothetical protein
VEFVFLDHTSPETSRKLLDVQLEVELEVRSAKGRIEKRAQAFWSEHVHRRFATVQMHRAQKSRDPVKMITVEMSDENAVYAIAFHPGPHQLNLRALAAIKQKHVSIAHESRR